MPEYWFLLPVGLAIGSVAMSSGVSGSNFWIPVYLLWLGLEPRVAFWVSLLSMLFGFGSGVVRNLRAGTVDWGLAARYLAYAGPAATVAAVVAVQAAQLHVLLAFSGFVVLLGARLLLEFVRHSRGEKERRHDGVRIPNAILAGALQGAIATGSGSVLLPSMVGNRRLDHHATAVGSTVVVVFACSLLAVVFRLDARLIETLQTRSTEILEMITFAGPGAIIGGQLGPRIAQKVPRRYLRLYLGILLLAVGGLVATRAL